MLILLDAASDNLRNLHTESLNAQHVIIEKNLPIKGLLASFGINFFVHLDLNEYFLNALSPVYHQWCRWKLVALSQHFLAYLEYEIILTSLDILCNTLYNNLRINACFGIVVFHKIL